MKNLIKSFFVLLTALFSFNYAYGQSVIEDAIKVAPEGWTSVITNGNLANDNVANYLAKEAPSADILGAAIVKGAGKGNSRGIVVKSADDPAQAWDTQFWIKLNQALPAGTKLHVEFDYAASQDAKVTTQAHGEPGGYQHWAMIGDVNFTTEWQHFSTDIEVSDDMATGNDGNGLLSIAFNLAEENTATEYYFDNFGVWIHEKDVINDATEHEIDRKFTSVAALEDQLFVIVNEADGKAIYNKDYQNLAYGTYPNAVTGAAYMWRIHSLADETDPEIQSCYTLEAVKTDGSSIGLWGSPAIYLNSGAEGGFDGCFVLGFNDQYGQDVQYGAVWEIEYINGMGFTLKNKARGGYFAGVNPAPAVTNPVYWTFCTLKADAVIPEPGPDPGPGPEPYAPTADGELIPDFFSICDEGNIPYGYIVNFNGEERISSNSYGGGPRMFNFAEGGDFTKALYLREGYIQYGTIKKLPLEAGKK